ncbi:MAG: hypothetical protein ACKVOK_03350 [Flavobacteriales bacterium]
MDKEFPQYRKLINGKSYYAIHSGDHMTEFAQLGKMWQRYDIVAKILPERNLIADLLACHGGAYVAITQQEFENTIQTAE